MSDGHAASSQHHKRKKECQAHHITDAHSALILNVSRNSLTGSAILLAGFFKVPFAPRFAEVNSTATAFYLVTLLLAFCAVIVFFSVLVQAATATGAPALAHIHNIL